MLSLIDRHRIDECRLLKRPREAVNILAIRGVQRQQVFLDAILEAFCRTSDRFVPFGTTDNSPAIHRWVRGNNKTRVPHGQLNQSSLRDSNGFLILPAINRWAILNRPLRGLDQHPTRLLLRSYRNEH